MSRLRTLLIALLILAVALAWWIHRRNNRPQETSFAKVRRETLVSTLMTNGKVEPADWVAVRAERAGVIDHVDVQKGQQVAKGTLLAELDSRDARAELQSDEAAVTSAQAQLKMLEQGGAHSARVDIQNAAEKDRMELKIAQRDYDSLQRLQAKQAATRQEVAEAQQRVQALETDLEALERKGAALVGGADRAAAEARLRQAIAAREQARARLERSHLHSPIAGVVYDLPAKDGAYLNVGDLVAQVGTLHLLRVHVYVDEPELGRVAIGMPVTITWDALPGRRWKGLVEKTPTQVVALGTRQVGEVICTIDNPGLELIPGTNINAEIVSRVVENGLTIPKEAVRRQNGQDGVFVLRSDRVEWQPVKLGASSVTRTALQEGLNEGDSVALTSETPLQAGERVQPQSQ
jgi:HlyD family secretion protein